MLILIPLLAPHLTAVGAVGTVIAWADMVACSVAAIFG